MDRVVITIARQYGSGGRTVGKMLAKDLGINYYNTDLIKKASEISGINEALFAKADEYTNEPFLKRLKKNQRSEEILSPSSPDYTCEANLFRFQAKAIRELADTESCVIIGRAADYVLRDYDNVLSVFVHAPQEFLLEQAGKKLSMTGKELEKHIAKIDKGHAEYYKLHTGREWTDARNYDLCLDSSKLGFERCVEEIKAYMKVRFS